MNLTFDAMRDRICRKCIDGDRKGGCRLPVGEECALEQNFPRIVSLVSNLRSASYDDYVAALRSNICAECTDQLPGGSCKKRDALECALDRYYPLVIQVIEAVEESLGQPPVAHHGQSAGPAL